MQYKYILLLSVLFLSIGTMAQSVDIPAYSGLTNDTLGFSRRLFGTAIYNQNQPSKLSVRAARSILRSTPRAFHRYQLGNWLKPVVPVMSLSGLLMVYDGLKGVQKSGLIRTTGTQQSMTPDITVVYTERSLPKLLGGLGLLAGSICLLEFSNELVITSIRMHNDQSKSRTSHPESIKFGLTSSMQIGFVANL